VLLYVFLSTYVAVIGAAAAASAAASAGIFF